MAWIGRKNGLAEELGRGGGAEKGEGFALWSASFQNANDQVPFLLKALRKEASWLARFTKPFLPSFGLSLLPWPVTAHLEQGACAWPGRIEKSTLTGGEHSCPCSVHA